MKYEKQYHIEMHNLKENLYGIIKEDQYLEHESF